jgi:hypothetical protein
MVPKALRCIIKLLSLENMKICALIWNLVATGKIDCQIYMGIDVRGLKIQYLYNGLMKIK